MQASAGSKPICDEDDMQHHNGQSSLLGALQVLAATASNDHLRDRYASSGRATLGEFAEQQTQQHQAATSSDASVTSSSDSTTAVQENISRRGSVDSDARQRSSKKKDRTFSTGDSSKGGKSKDETSEDESVSRNSGSGDDKKTGLRKGKWTVRFLFILSFQVLFSFRASCSGCFKFNAHFAN